MPRNLQTASEILLKWNWVTLRFLSREDKDGAEQERVRMWVIYLLDQRASVSFQFKPSVTNDCGWGGAWHCAQLLLKLMQKEKNPNRNSQSSTVIQRALWLNVLFSVLINGPTVYQQCKTVISKNTRHKCPLWLFKRQTCLFDTAETQTESALENVTEQVGSSRFFCLCLMHDHMEKSRVFATESGGQWCYLMWILKRLSIRVCVV